MTNRILRDNLISAFSSAMVVAYLNNLPAYADYDQQKARFTHFDVISNLFADFWRRDFLEDMIMIDGSGVNLNLRFILNMSERFWAGYLLDMHSLQMESEAAGGFSHSGDFYSEALIKVVAEIIYLKSEAVKQNSLFSGSTRAGIKPVVTGTIEEIVEFVRTNNWLVPLYLVFSTGCYAEIKAALTSSGGDKMPVM